MDGKNKTHLPTSPPETPPELQPGFQAELHSLIHEDEGAYALPLPVRPAPADDPAPPPAVTVIPCTDLTIGTWRRMATTVGKHDLVAYLCDAKRCLTWFIHSAGHGFKMEIAYDSVVSTEFANAAPGAGLATFILARPPAFFLEAPAGTSPQGDRCALPGTRVWKRCADWTEGMQATKVLRHELVGSAVQLAHVLASFHAGKASGEVRLHEPAYTAAPASSSNPTSPPSLPLTSSLLQQQQQQQHLDLDLSPALAGGLSALPTYYTQAQDVFEPSHVPRRSFSGTPLLLAPNPPDYPAAAASPSMQPSSSSSSGHPSPYTRHALSNHPSPYIQSPSNHPSPYASSSNPSPTPYARFPGLQQQYPQPHQHQYAYGQGPSQQPGTNFSAPAPAFTDFAEQQAQAQVQLQAQAQAQAQMLEYTLPLSARAFPSAPAYFSPHPPPRPLSQFGTPSPPLLTATAAPFAPPDADLQTMQMQYDALRRPSR